MQYRQDIQIMRGVAVMQVVLYHLAVPGFHGGFLGVDMFFVISGYLMASLYASGQWSDFFAKRIARIAPAYLCVLAITIGLTAVLVNPSDYAQVRAQALYALGFLSNIGYWAENSYFDKASFKPLLHFWSLAVEVQFYLLVPLIAWMSRARTLIGIAILLASLGICSVMVGISPKTAFFWLPFRLWEFLLGFLLARVSLRTISGANMIGAASLLLSVMAPFAWNVGGDGLGYVHGHPGALALVVASSSAATIAFGLPRIVEISWPGRLLEKLGDYSYAIYLVHFPVITLVLYQPFGGTILAPPTLLHFAGIVVLTGFGTILLHRHIERAWARVPPVPLALRYGSVAVLLGICVFAGSIAQSLLVPAEKWRVSQAWSDRDTYRCGKLFRILHPKERMCEITGNSGPRSVMLVGDSHADALKWTFAQAAKQAGVSVHFAVDNTPLLPGGMTVDALMTEAWRRPVSAIVLHYSGNGLTPSVLRQVVERSEAQGVKVALVMPVPVWPASVPALLTRRLELREPLPKQTRTGYGTLHEARRAEMKRIPSLAVYDVADIFCPTDCEMQAADYRPYYFDSHHLTLTGSAQLRPLFDRLLSEAFFRDPG